MEGLQFGGFSNVASCPTTEEERQLESPLDQRCETRLGWSFGGVLGRFPAFSGPASAAFRLAPVRAQLLGANSKRHDARCRVPKRAQAHTARLLSWPHLGSTELRLYTTASRTSRLASVIGMFTACRNDMLPSASYIFPVLRRPVLRSFSTRLPHPRTSSAIVLCNKVLLPPAHSKRHIFCRATAVPVDVSRLAPLGVFSTRISRLRNITGKHGQQARPQSPTAGPGGPGEPEGPHRNGGGRTRTPITVGHVFLALGRSLRTPLLLLSPSSLRAEFRRDPFGLTFALAL